MSDEPVEATPPSVEDVNILLDEPQAEEDEPIQAVKTRKKRSDAGISKPMNPKALEVRDANREANRLKKEALKAEEDKVLQEKIVKKAVQIKKAQMKKEKQIDNVPVVIEPVKTQIKPIINVPKIVFYS
jgi:beta-lactamase regulating signal transducer with metallopeptidase domain